MAAQAGMPVPQMLREADRSPSRLLGVNRSRGIRGGSGREGLGVVGGFCRGCGGFAGEVPLVGLRGRTLRKVRIHFSSESRLHFTMMRLERAAARLSRHYDKT